MVNKLKERTMVEDRIAALEARVLRLEEARQHPQIAPVRPAVAAPPPKPRPAREPIDIEDFLGGRVLAWLGGVAVLAGLAFLLTVAISRGWIGESGRTVLAGALSAALLIAGARLRETRVRNDPTLAAAAAGIAGLFGTLVVAGQVYDLLPAPLALALSVGVAAAATGLAIRWRAQVIGWLGLIGALLAPALFGGGFLFLAVAYGATVAALVWQRWTALAFAAFAIAAPQWVLWDGSSALSLAVFGVLTTAAAVGFELRRREPAVRPAAIALLILDAILLDAAGAATLPHPTLWLAAVAAAHLAIGLIPGLSRELKLVALGIGVILADIAFAQLTGGLPLVLGWAAGAIGFSALLKRATTPSDRAFALAGLGGHLLAALAHALVFDATPGANSTLDGIAAIAAIGISAAVAARLAPRLRPALDGLALAALAYISVLTLDGLALAAAFAGQAIALSALKNDRVAAYGALAFVTLASVYTTTVLAPPTALIDGLDAPLEAAGALLAVIAALLAIPRLRPAAAVTALYLASVELVTHAGAAGQTSLSVLWALAGVATLIAGLVLDRARLREAALALLALTAGKVFIYDLASLDSMARVGSLVGLGLLLLTGGFAWQRVRPRALPDLREAGADAR